MLRMLCTQRRLKVDSRKRGAQACGRHSGGGGGEELWRLELCGERFRVVAAGEDNLQGLAVGCEGALGATERAAAGAGPMGCRRGGPPTCRLTRPPAVADPAARTFSSLVTKDCPTEFALPCLFSTRSEGELGSAGLPSPASRGGGSGQGTGARLIEPERNIRACFQAKWRAQSKE